MSTSAPPPNPPKALPKPETKDSSPSFSSWYGLGLHALISVGLVFVFLVLLPWVFPGVRQSLPKIKELEQKVENIERHIAQLPASTTPDLTEIRAEIAKLDQKLQEKESGTAQTPSLEHHHLLQLGYLLRLEGALVGGEKYESIFSKLISIMSLKEQDFPILISHQKAGLKPLSQVIAQVNELARLQHESENTGLSLPKSEELPHEVLSKFLKVRKIAKPHETPHDSTFHQILTLLIQNKVEEAYEIVKKMDGKEFTLLSQDIQNLLQGRQEVEKLWQIWESQMSLKPNEEKGS